MNTPPRRGTLFLVPTPLDFGCLDPTDPPSLQSTLPGHTIATAARLNHWITENAKSTRAFLKRVNALQTLSATVQAISIVELPRAVHKKGDHLPGAADDESARKLLAPALLGHDIGLVSEAGMPAIADPGASIVRNAHGMGLQVIPLTGPISLMLALAASGLNGQHFAFVGYVPQETTARAQRLRELERQALQTGQTQILIETPYRNPVLLEALLKVLQPDTRLAVSTGITLDQPGLRSATVLQWRQASDPSLNLALPAVFLIGR